MIEFDDSDPAAQSGRQGRQGAQGAAERGAADVVAAYRYLRRSGLADRWQDLLPLLDALVAQVDAVGWTRSSLDGAGQAGRAVADEAERWLLGRPDAG